MYAWVYFGALCSVALIYVSVFTPVPCCLIIIALQYSLKSGSVILPALFFFLQIALAVWSLLWVHRNFRIVCSTSLKNAVEILIGIALNLQIALGSILIFTMLILPIQEHGVSLHLFVSSLFHQCLNSFLHTGLLSPQVGLFLSILFFLLQW